MKVRNCLLLLLAFALFIIKANAQDPDEEETSKYSFDYSKIVPGMPENASLGAYGNTPVNLAKGVPNINFTLYTLSKGGVSIPISISYTSTGIKYNDIPSCVGMSWQLNAGGSINRSVNGIVDEDWLIDNMAAIDSARIMRQNDHVNSHNTQDTAALVTTNDYDFSLDNYFYNFPGHSGAMYLGTDGTFIPDKEYSRIRISAANHLDSFSIKDDAGNTYYFGSYTDNSTVYNTLKYNKQSRTSYYARVAWKLNRIVTATKQQILFEYQSYAYEYRTLDTERYDVYVNNSGSVNVGACNYSVGFNGSSFTTTRFVNSAELLTKITTDDQEVLFQYYTDTTLHIFERKLSAVKVYSKISQDTVKRVSLNYTGDYLESFTEIDKSGVTDGKKHSFQYNGSYRPNTYSLARDIFGYYNSASSNNSLIDNPSMISLYYQAGVASRAINESAAQSGILTEITYPTGGKTNLEYEYNAEGTGFATVYAPGLRVKSIWDTDVTSKIYHKKNFYYRGLAGIAYADMTIVTENSAVVDPAMVNVFHSDPLNSDGYDGYFYENVITENIGPSEDIGVVEKTYERDYYTSQYELYNRSSPLLIRKDIFIDDTFHLQKSTLYEYENYRVQGMTAFTYILRKPIPFVGYFTYENDPTQRYCCPPFSIYQGYDTKYVLKPWIYNLKKTTTKEFSSRGDSLVTITENLYNSNPVSLQRTEITGSEDITSEVNYYYPFDYPVNGTLLAMANSNIISPVIKEEHFVNSVLKREKENNYAAAGSGVYVLNNQVIRDVPTTRTQTLNYYGYNQKVQLLSRGRTKDVTTSYIWDYLNELPIAEAINADTLSIAYSSFEADGKGRWTFSGTPAVDSTAVTGKKTYGLNSGTITRSGLSSPVIYFVSYWSKGSAITITGTQSGWPKTLAIVNRKGQNWTFYEHKITGQTSLSLSGSVTIDELRLYPEKAQMTSYTYQPLIGMTSQNDVNGRITYYEYDGLDRLVLVRDQYRNVLKRICYNYLGQPEDCPQAIYWNKAISRVAKKTCGAGYTGTEVVYSVPAAKYSSSVSQAIADSIAMDDWLTNAASYITANSTCVPIYYNVAKSGSFSRATCDSGYITSPVTYNVSAGTYNSLISQADADAKAQADVDANGQNWANANGICTMYCPSCEAEGKKCINFVCETGVKIYEGTSIWDPRFEMYICTYHYEFSDGSWSENYFEFSPTECFGS